MKRETLNTIVLTAAVCVILLQAQQNYTAAGPQPPASRTVPTVLQSFVPPSKMVAISAMLHPTDPDGVIQSDINLEPGEVFVLTAVSCRVALSRGTGGGLRAIRRGGPTAPVVAFAKAETGTYEGAYRLSNFYHLTYPSGIRFARLPNGKADLFLVGATSTNGTFTPTDLPDVTLQGYITNDF